MKSNFVATDIEKTEIVINYNTSFKGIVTVSNVCRRVIRSSLGDQPTNVLESSAFSSLDGYFQKFRYRVTKFITVISRYL